MAIIGWVSRMISDCGMWQAVDCISRGGTEKTVVWTLEAEWNKALEDTVVWLGLVDLGLNLATKMQSTLVNSSRIFYNPS